MGSRVVRREKSVERGRPGAAQALSWHDETLCKRALVLVGLTGGNHHPALDAGWTRVCALSRCHKAKERLPLWLGFKMRRAVAAVDDAVERIVGEPASRRRYFLNHHFHMSGGLGNSFCTVVAGLSSRRRGNHRPAGSRCRRGDDTRLFQPTDAAATPAAA